MVKGGNWTQSTLEERVWLYEAVKKLMDQGLIHSWNELFNNAFGREVIVGTDYEKNFSRGTIRRAKAGQIYRFIRDHYPGSVDDLDEQLRINNQQTGYEDQAWKNFVEANGVFKDVRLMFLDQRGLGIVGYADQDPVSESPVKLGQKFCFELKGKEDAHLILLQKVDEDWYVVPLTQDCHSTPIKAGKNLLPTNPVTGQPSPLWEDKDTGIHEFVFLNASLNLLKVIDDTVRIAEIIPKTTLNKLAGELEDAPKRFSVYRLKVLFTQA